MTRDAFATLVAAARLQSPSWFDQVEPPAREEQIPALEQQLGLSLPAEYRAFLMEHGAGYFGKMPICSADPASDWYLPEEGRLSIVHQGFLPVSEDGAGGFYGFRYHAGICAAEMLYWYPDEANGHEPAAPSFYQWIAQAALP